MIVISIIGILAVTMIPAFAGVQERARDTGRITAIESVRTSMETYGNDAQNTTYATWASASGSCLTTVEGTYASVLKNWKAPTDPKTGYTHNPCTTAWSYGYVGAKKSTNADTYAVFAKLEAPRKSNITDNLNTVISNGVASAGSFTWGTLWISTSTTNAYYVVYGWR